MWKIAAPVKVNGQYPYSLTTDYLCSSHILYLQSCEGTLLTLKPNPKDTWLQMVQGVASIHYSAFNPVLVKKVLRKKLDI